MHPYSQHSLVDEHEDSVRIHDWVARHHPMSNDIHFPIEEQGKMRHNELTRPNQSFEDFTSWSSSTTSSTPALDTVNDDEDHHQCWKDETDTESEMEALNSLLPMTFRERTSIDGSSSEEETQNVQTLAIDKPLPLPPPTSSPTHHSPSPSVSVSTAESTRSRKPSIVSLSGYHLPSSVQITAPSPTQLSPRPSLVSLSRKSSLNGRTSHLVGSHSRRQSLSRQPSLPLLSPSSSLTLFEEDDKLGVHEKHVSVHSTMPAHKWSPSKPNSHYRDGANLKDLSRSGSASSMSSSSHRRVSSVNSCHSNISSTKARRASCLPRHSSTGNVLNSVPYSSGGHHLHSPSLPSLQTSIRRSTDISCRLSTHGMNSSHGTLPRFDDGDLQSSCQSTSMDSPISETVSPFLVPPPTAIFGSSSDPSGIAAESTTAATLRNRDAVYIDASDLAEVQRRLAELLIASGTADSPVGGVSSHFSERDEGQVIEYYSNDYVHSHREPCPPMPSPTTELPSPSLESHKVHVPKKEQSHWSPSYSNEDLPLSPSYHMASSDHCDIAKPTPSSTAGDSSRYGGAFGVVPLVALGMVGSASAKSRKSKAKKGIDDAEKRKRKSSMGGNDKSGKTDMVTDDGRIEDGNAAKPPRQRLASLIARAIGNGNGADPSNTTPNLTSPATSIASGSSSIPLLDITPGPATVTQQQPVSALRSRSTSLTTAQRDGALSTFNPPVPATPSPPPEPTSQMLPPSIVRMRSSSNARASPLRIEVPPHGVRPAAAVTPSPVIPTPTPASSTAGPTVRGRSVSITGGRTTPLSPAMPPAKTPGRMRSESQISDKSNISQSSTSSSLVSSSTSHSSASLGPLFDRFPTPAESGDETGLVEKDDSICGEIAEVSDEEARSDASDIEDDGAYYVRCFERSLGDNRLRAAKSRERKIKDDGDSTETEGQGKGPPHKPKRPILKHLSRPSSSLLSKSSLPFALPISPPPSISASPILPVQTTQLPSAAASSADLLDEDPFAAASVTLVTGNNVTPPAGYFQNHPSPFFSPSTRRDSSSSNLPYLSQSPYASQSVNALHKVTSANASEASSPFMKAKSLINPGDLPPSKAWKEVEPQSAVLPPAVSNSSTYTITPSSKSAPATPVRGGGGPTSPGSRTPTKSRLRMSVSGMVSRLTFGSSANRSREASVAVPLLPPTPTSESEEHKLPFSAPPLPTPAATPVIGAAKFPFERQVATPSSELETGVGTDVDLEDGDDSLYEPPSPRTPWSPYLDASSKRKSSGLGIGSNDTGSRLSLSYMRAKKYMLVVSGTGLTDERAHESVKEWCKNLGEVRRWIVKPNGDLHLEFKRGSVSDAMCRTQTMTIQGAGSVNLSWYKGKDKPVKVG
ncbi:hypothetical protein L218DRAFT_331887 [Marasmius fiardii PR-910]|nr:hypothetical protein L218DRAFT_331887 [Marasmius fiardii PR-910]